MLRAPTHDADWVARVVEARVRLDLFDFADDDYAFALLGVTIVRAVSDSALSDDDAYPLLVRFWDGQWPRVDWPAHAPAVARRCAGTLAQGGGCEMDAIVYAPTDESLRTARDAVIAELGLTQRDLLAALAEHWDEVADMEMPIDSGCSLLAFARHVLLGPLVGACALIWSTLDSTATTTGATPMTITWDEWSPMDIDAWGEVVTDELDRLARPAQRVPAGCEAADDLLASARAALLGSQDGAERVTASIIRTSGWPGETEIVDPIAALAVRHALENIDAVDPATDNEELVNLVQDHVLPRDELLIGWLCDPSFGALRDHAGSSRTGAEMLHAAADWLTWSIARAAVEAAAAMRRPPGSTG